MNWWRDELNEPFVTNVSALNCVFCWFVWCYCGFIMCFCGGCYIPILCIALSMIAIQSTAQQKKECISGCCKGLGRALKWLILGKMQDAMYEMTRQENEPLDDEEYRDPAIVQERKEFFAKHRKGFATMLYDETRECPICCKEFEENEQIVQL